MTYFTQETKVIREAKRSQLSWRMFENGGDNEENDDDKDNDDDDDDNDNDNNDDDAENDELTRQVVAAVGIC